MTQDSDLFDQRVRQQVYQITLGRGYPPSQEELAGRLSVPASEIGAAYKRLAAAHMLVLQPGTDEILMANPFSAVPTPFRVQTARFECYGNCIWDALGIPAMLKQDARISTSCAECGAALSVSIANGALQSAEGVVHFALPARRWWDDIVFN